MKILYTFLLTLVLLSTAFAGGPWPQPRGFGYFKLSEWWVISDQHYTDAGLIDPNTTTGLFNTSLYAEYGIADRLTGILYFPFFSRTYMNNLVSATTGEVIKAGEALNGIGDTDVALKYALTRPGARLPLSATLRLGLPLGNNRGGSEGNLQTGDGEFNQLLLLDAGYSFPVGSQSGYASAYGGFNNRTNDFSDELRYGLEAGLGLFERRLWLIGRLQAVESLRNGKTAAEAMATSIFANNTEYLSWSGEVAWYLTRRFGVSASYASVFRGEIIFAAPAYSVGVFVDLK